MHNANRMGRPSTLPLASLALGGELEALLLGWREQGKSYERMARSLSERGVDVSSATVRRWIKELST